MPRNTYKPKKTINPHRPGREPIYTETEARERRKQQTAQWHKNHPDKVKELHARSRSARRTAMTDLTFGPNKARMVLGIFTNAEVQYLLGLIGRQAVVDVFGSPQVFHRGSGYSMQEVLEYTQNHVVSEEKVVLVEKWLNEHLEYWANRPEIDLDLHNTRVRNLALARERLRAKTQDGGKENATD